MTRAETSEPISCYLYRRDDRLFALRCRPALLGGIKEPMLIHGLGHINNRCIHLSPLREAKVLLGSGGVIIPHHLPPALHPGGLLVDECEEPEHRVWHRFRLGLKLRHPFRKPGDHLLHPPALRVDNVTLAGSLRHLERPHVGKGDVADVDHGQGNSKRAWHVALYHFLHRVARLAHAREKRRSEDPRGVEHHELEAQLLRAVPGGALGESLGLGVRASLFHVGPVILCEELIIPGVADAHRSGAGGERHSLDAGSVARAQDLGGTLNGWDDEIVGVLRLSHIEWTRDVADHSAPSHGGHPLLRRARCEVYNDKVHGRANSSDDRLVPLVVAHGASHRVARVCEGRGDVAS
mmetsp:Transcript_13529/g.36150  ORF Transcript_13529/g.36150 Transcript_13529/m.36150 type:complete len:351 (-) Transcript_13529:181-1233(-)